MQSDYRHHTKLRFCLVRIRNLGHRPMEALLLKPFVLSAFQAFCLCFKTGLLGFSALRHTFKSGEAFALFTCKKKRDTSVSHFKRIPTKMEKFETKIQEYKDGVDSSSDEEC